MTSNNLGIITTTGISPITNSVTQTTPIMYTGNGLTITKTPSNVVSDILDKYLMNQLVIEHKVSEFEMMKLQEVKPDYADDIKENLARNISREVIKKTSFTKKKLPDEDTHHFMGRVWVFTKEELIKLIEDSRNA
jgi:hypothetical protein